MNPKSSGITSYHAWQSISSGIVARNTTELSNSPPAASSEAIHPSQTLQTIFSTEEIPYSERNWDLRTPRKKRKHPAGGTEVLAANNNNCSQMTRHCEQLFRQMLSTMKTVKQEIPHEPSFSVRRIIKTSGIAPVDINDSVLEIIFSSSPESGSNHNSQQENYDVEPRKYFSMSSHTGGPNGNCLFEVSEFKDPHSDYLGKSPLFVPRCNNKTPKESRCRPTPVSDLQFNEISDKYSADGSFLSPLNIGKHSSKIHNFTEFPSDDDTSEKITGKQRTPIDIEKTTPPAGCMSSSPVRTGSDYPPYEAQPNFQLDKIILQKTVETEYVQYMPSDTETTASSNSRRRVRKRKRREKIPPHMPHSGYDPSSEDGST